MFAKNSTDRDMLRVMTTQQLRKVANLGASPSLTPDQRYMEARFAQQMRNFWFTATGFPIRTAHVSDDVPRPTAITPTFAEAIIITDILSMYDYKFTSGDVIPQASNVSRFLLQILRNSGAAYGEDFFGLVGPIGQEFITKHEKNNSQGIVSPAGGGAGQTVLDTQSKWLQLVPRMLAPYETLRCNWDVNINNTAVDAGSPAFDLQLGFRAVKALLADNPYSYFSERLDAEIKRYIAETTPETFFLELTFPFASLPAVGASAVFQTDQMQRPLMVLGACSNLEGCQARLEDRSKSYRFTLADSQPIGTTAPPDRARTVMPFYKDVPLNLWAPNTDLRATNLYNMWPVPHLLEPGSVFRITLTNGLLPSIAQVAQEVAATRNSQPPRITFLCRTV